MINGVEFRFKFIYLRRRKINKERNKNEFKRIGFPRKKERGYYSRNQDLK